MGPFRIKAKGEQEGLGLLHEMVDEKTGKMRGHLSAWADNKESLAELMDVCGKMLERDLQHLKAEEARKGNA